MKISSQNIAVTPPVPWLPRQDDSAIPKRAKERKSPTGHHGRILALIGTALALPGAALADPCIAPLPKPGTSFTGTVRYVGDGDSICVGNGGSGSAWVEVRVADFYAPELNSSGGAQAKAAMGRVALGRTVECTAGKRSYDRVVARCTLNGTSIGDLMRREGVTEGGRGR